MLKDFSAIFLNFVCHCFVAIDGVCDPGGLLADCIDAGVGCAQLGIQLVVFNNSSQPIHHSESSFLCH